MAHWIAVKAVVGENRDRSLAVTRPDDRAAMMGGVIPDYFRIYTGRHEAGPVSYYRSSHTVGRFSQKPSENEVIHVGDAKNIQSTTFAVGSMFAHVNASTARGVNVEDIVIAVGVYDNMRLWPISMNVFDWPRGNTLPTEAMNVLAKNLNQATATVGRWV